MTRRVAQWTAQLALTLPATFAWLGGCGVSNTVIAEGDEAGPGAFTTGDAATADVSTGLIDYCPTNNCPPGWTTCPNSRFPCDVNLENNLDNCGACGHACPTATGWEAYSCIGAACVVNCATGANAKLDCDGLADNGCETSGSSNENCGACGNKCPDPANPCIYYIDTREMKCGCPVGKQWCTSRCLSKDADDHCGACNNKCNPNGDGGTLPPNRYYGCKNEQCGALKCKTGFDNCDGLEDNGCETSLTTNTDCGACGNACPTGQACRVDPDKTVRCMCPPGQTFCGTGHQLAGLDEGACVDVATNQDHCGACFASCLATDNGDNSAAVCKHGTCVSECHAGLADCNNSALDGCEVNLNSDPRNCGSCGSACDAVAGQACVGGRCVVEPCDADAGGGTAR